MNKEIKRFLRIYGLLMLFVPFIFFVVGIFHYFEGNNEINLWLWPLISFIGITIECYLLDKYMSKKQTRNDIIKSTESGKLYIETSDFFKQPKIISLIDKLMQSSVYKKIKGISDKK